MKDCVVSSHQIENQRQYLQRIWRHHSKGSTHEYGLPLNYVPKHLVSLGGSRQVNTQVRSTILHLVSDSSVFTSSCAVCSSALMNVFLLEVHPSLCLAAAVFDGLVQAHKELCQLRQATSISDKLKLRQKLLQQALQSWRSLASPGASYSPQIQKDVGFSFKNKFT